MNGVPKILWIPSFVLKYPSISFPKHLNLWFKVLLNFFVTLRAAIKLLVWARLQDLTLVLGCCDWFRSLYDMSICSFAKWYLSGCGFFPFRGCSCICCNLKAPSITLSKPPIGRFSVQKPALVFGVAEFVTMITTHSSSSSLLPTISILTPFWSQGRTFHWGIVRILLISQHHLSLALFPSNFSKHFIKRQQWFLSKNLSSHLI